MLLGGIGIHELADFSSNWNLWNGFHSRCRIRPWRQKDAKVLALQMPPVSRRRHGDKLMPHYDKSSSQDRWEGLHQMGNHLVREENCNQGHFQGGTILGSIGQHFLEQQGRM